jgi:copper chaperone CopZ
LANTEKPALAKPTPIPTNEPPATFRIDDEFSVTLQVTGLFMPERVDDFRKMLKGFPETKLLNIEFKTAKATIAYTANSDLFRGARTEQIIERINNRVRQISGYTLAIKPLSTIPRDKLERVEIPIIGLDCKACSFAVYGILEQIEGVEQATASFHDGLAVAWIDPTKTNRAALEESLKKRGVQLKLP